MSCDYHIRCKTCGSNHGFNDANHAVELMRHILNNAAHIAALVPLIDDSPEEIELRVYYGRLEPRWFAKHLGHELAVFDEYGAEDGKCGERYTCESCSASHRCGLDKSHEGKHAPR